MKLIEYIQHYDDLKPVIKTAFTAGVKLGLWTGGIIIMIIFSVLHFLFNFQLL